VFLYGCETWSLTLREKYRLRVFENRVLRILRLKRGTCIMRNFILYSPSIIRMIKSRMMRWTGHVTRMEKRNAYRLFEGKPEGKRPLGRPRCRWVDNIKMDLREIGLDGMDWMDLAQDM
jgi:hypothetical protein